MSNLSVLQTIAENLEAKLDERGRDACQTEVLILEHLIAARVGASNIDNTHPAAIHVHLSGCPSGKECTYNTKDVD
jgi:hypothetical protein